jgi:hypothetical protein
MTALSIAQVAERLGIRPKAALALVHSEALKAIDVSVQPSKRPHWKILKEDFERFVETRTFHATPQRRRRRRRQSKELKAYF